MSKRKRRQKVHQTPEPTEETVIKEEKSAPNEPEVVQPIYLKPEVENPISMQRATVKTVSMKSTAIKPVSVKPEVLKTASVKAEVVRKVTKKRAIVKTPSMKSTTTNSSSTKAEIKPVPTSEINTSKTTKPSRGSRTCRVQLVEYRPEIRREEPFEISRSLLQKLVPSSVKVTKGKISKQVVKLQSSSVSGGGLTEKNNEKPEVTGSGCIDSGMKSSGTHSESKMLAPLQQSGQRFMKTRKQNPVQKGNSSSSLCKITKATSVGNGKLCEVGQKKKKSFGRFRQVGVKYTRKKKSVSPGKGGQFKRSSNLQKKKKKNSGRHTYKVRQRIVVCKINPRSIRFTKAEISTKFTGINKTVHDTLHELKTGLISVEDIPKIIVFRSRGKNYTINNKRLFVFKQLSTYYREYLGTDLVISVLFHESLNRLKISRTFGCVPKNITEKNIKEKSKSIQSSKKFYVRSKKGRAQKYAPGENRMKKADIRRCRNGDDDFLLFSVAKSEFDYLNSDSEDFHEYMSTLDRTDSIKHVSGVGKFQDMNGLSDDSHKNRSKSHRFYSNKQNPKLGGYIEKSIEDNMRRLGFVENAKSWSPVIGKTDRHLLCLVCDDFFYFSHVCRGPRKKRKKLPLIRHQTI